MKINAKCASNRVHSVIGTLAFRVFPILTSIKSYYYYVSVWVAGPLPNELT